MPSGILAFAHIEKGEELVFWITDVAPGIQVITGRTRLGFLETESRYQCISKVTCAIDAQQARGDLLEFVFPR